MTTMRSINDINHRTVDGYSKHVGTDIQDYSRDAAAYHAAAQRQKKGNRTVLIVLLAILAGVLAAAVAFAVYIFDVSNQLNRGSKTDAELLAIEDALGGYSSNFNDPFYMLLLGSDARPGETASRTDTNIVARVDPVNDQVTLLSIPRDTKIEIPGHGTQKFNAAYAFGKVPGVIEATENLLGIDISHYAEVSFLDLKDLVDAVGGVTVEVETRIDDWRCDDGDGNHYVIEEGTQHLSGGPALTFARSRHYAEGDFVRQSNQRKLVQAIVEKVLSAPITDIPNIVSAAVKCVTTDLKLMDIIGLAQQFADNKDITIYSAMLPSYTQNINGISFVINDEEKTKEVMELFVAGKDPSGIVSTKSAPDISTNKVDTSSTLVFDDEPAVTPSTGTNNTNSSSSSSSNAGSIETPEEPEAPEVDDPVDPPASTQPEPEVPETGNGGEPASGTSE